MEDCVMIVWRLLSPLEGQRRPKPSIAQLGEAGGETLALSVQARDTLIFGPNPGCVHSNNLGVLPAAPLGPVTRAFHPGRHEGWRVWVTAIHKHKGGS